MCLEQAIDGSLGDKIALGIGERHGQLAGRQFRLLQGEIDDLLADIVGNTVPDPAGTAAAIFKARQAECQITIIPPVKRRLRNAELVQRSSDR